MIAVVSLLVVLTLSLLVTRIATVALVLTGLSRQSARFQARSAFTGVGFTTSESERVVQHPVRRRVLMLLMLLGNAGVVTALGSILLAFLGGEEGRVTPVQIVVLAGGLTALWYVATSPWIDRRLSNLITWAFQRFTDLDVRDYADLLRLKGDYAVREVFVGEEAGWLQGRSLEDLRLPEEGILCLAVQREDGAYLGAPRGGTRIEDGDVLVLYGRAGVLAEISRRQGGFAGWSEHRQAVEEREARQREEEAEGDGADEEEDASA